jgi:hypothetical protein
MIKLNYIKEKILNQDLPPEDHQSNQVALLFSSLVLIEEEELLFLNHLPQAIF